jgi:hypothetical protein
MYIKKVSKLKEEMAIYCYHYNVYNSLFFFFLNCYSLFVVIIKINDILRFIFILFYIIFLFK